MHIPLEPVLTRLRVHALKILLGAILARCLAITTNFALTAAGTSLVNSGHTALFRRLWLGFASCQARNGNLWWLIHAANLQPRLGIGERK
jgi:hypothetical protein